MLPAAGTDHVLQAGAGLCYDFHMTIRNKATKKERPSLTLGRAAAAKLNAIEGITVSQETSRAFAEFDRLGLSAAQRRLRLMKQFGAESG